MKLDRFLNASEIHRVKRYLPKLKAYVVKHNVPGTLTLPRFVGIYVGDGSCWIQLTFPKPHLIKIQVSVSSCDSKTNAPLLHDIKDFFQCGSVYVDKGTKIWKVTKLSDCERIIHLLLNSELHTYRREQAYVFLDVLNILKTPFRKSRSSLKRLVELKWQLGVGHKKGSFALDMEKLEKFMTLNHVL